MFRVTVRKFKRLETLHLALCAECAFTTIPNRRRMASVKRPDGEEDLIFFRDVEKVELIRTL